MKLHNILATVLFLMAAGANAQNVTISGNISEAPDSSEITIFEFGLPNNDGTINSQTVKTNKDKQYLFKLQIDEPTLFHIECRYFTATVAACPGDEIFLNNQNVINAGKEQANYNIATGGIWNEYNNDLVALNKKYGVVKSMAANKTTAEKAVSNPEYEKYLDEYNAINAKWRAKLIDKIKADPSNRWNICNISSFGDILPTDQDMYEPLADSIKQCKFGKSLLARIERSKSGNKMPDFTLKDDTGNSHTLKELLNGKNYLLIDFWASWCNPCRKAIPLVKELAKKYASDGLGVVSISIDTDSTKWLKAIEEEQMPWTQLTNDGELSKKLEVKAIPSLYLIDKDGNVLFAKKYGDAVPAGLRKVLGK